MTVLFLTQVFGVHLTRESQLIVVLMSVVTAIGTAGVPSGSIPLLMIVLAIVGISMEGIAIILGIDRILDMFRTTLKRDRRPCPRNYCAAIQKARKMS